MAERTQIGIDIDAVDKASDKLGDVADEAKKLEEADPTVTVAADDKATADLTAIGDAADRLDNKDPRLEIMADISSAKADLAELERSTDALTDGSVKRAGGGVDELGHKFEKAGDVAKGFAGGTASEIANMTGAFGPAGEAIGQMTEGLLGAEGSLSSMLTAGLGIGAVTLVMNELNKASERAAARAQDVADSIKEINRQSDQQVLGQFSKTVAELIVNGTPLADYFKNLAEGSLEGARRLLDLMTQQGYSADITDKLTGAIKEEERARGQQKKTTDDYGDSADAATDSTKKLTTATDESRVSADLTKLSFESLRGELSKQDTIETFGETMATAVGKIKGGAQLTTDEIRGIKGAIIDAGEAAHLNPIVVQSELDKVDQGDIEGAWYDTQHRVNQMGAIVFESRIKNPVLGKPVPDGGGSGTFSTLNVNMPPGARAVDIARLATGHARRAGRHYGDRARARR